MEYNPLEVTVISAKDIKDTNLIGKQDVYAVVWLSNDTKNKQKTPIHRDGGRNPSWNHTVRFNVDESAARKSGLVLHVLLRCEKSLGDKDVGEVAVPVKELLDAVDSKSAQFVSYQVRTPSGKPKGVLNLSYKFGDRVSSQPYQAPPAAQPACCGKPDAPPVSATKVDAQAVPYAIPYPAPGAYPPSPAPGQPYPPPPLAGYPPGVYPPPPPCAYPPPPPGAYPPPPGAYPPGYGYGYPPQPYGYPPAVPVQQQQPAKKNKFGLGLGAGLLGGAIGGLILGDMVGDAAEANYDAGFADGFDF